MANYKLKIGTTIYGVDEIIKDGASSSLSYVGFPNYDTSALPFECHETAFGYKVNGTDLANSIVALYRDYIGGGDTNSGSTQNDDQANNASYQGFNNYGKTISMKGTIPAWCTKLRVIVIGAGGGGGGAGAATAGGGNDAGSGGGGGGGGFIAGTFDKFPNSNVYDISLGGCGRGGYYEGRNGLDGYEARNPDITYTRFIHGNKLFQASCGEPGGGGAPAVASNNQSNTSLGGGVFISTETGVSDLIKQTGTDGGYGNATNPGEGGIIQYNANYPALNTNQGNAPDYNNTTNTIINQDNQLPGYGQGGWGGLSTNNTNYNGYGGQCGGRSLVRVYFIR